MNTDEQKIGYALGLWANYIETGNILLCAEDAEKQGEKVKALNLEQMKTVVRLRDLAAKAYAGKITIDEP